MTDKNEAPHSTNTPPNNRVDVGAVLDRINGVFSGPRTEHESTIPDAIQAGVVVVHFEVETPKSKI